MVADVADAGDGVAVNGAEGEHGDGLDAGEEPGGEVEVLGVAGDGFAAPLHAGGEEPREGQDHPPDRARHAEEVDEQEHDGAESGACRSHAYEVAVASDLLVPGDETDDEAERDQEVTPAQEDDGAFGVLEPSHIDEESRDRHQRRHETQDRPQSDPKCCEGVLIAGEIGTFAWRGTILDSPGRDAVVEGVIFGDGEEGVAAWTVARLSSWWSRAAAPRAGDGRDGRLAGARVWMVRIHA